MPKHNFFLKQYYIKLSLWIRQLCGKLTNRQRQMSIYGLSFVYLICSLIMIVQIFLPQKKQSTFIPKNKLKDIPAQRDSLNINNIEYNHLISNYLLWRINKKKN